MKKSIVTLTDDDMKNIWQAFQDIERWEGESYQIFDEVGEALHVLKTTISRVVFEGKVVEE